MSNKLIGTVCGYVAQDADVKEKFVTFSLAINKSTKQPDGTYVERAMWLRCKDFMVDRGSKMAKGALISVTGEITWDEHKSGEKSAFYAPELRVMNLDVVRWANNDKDKSGAREDKKQKRSDEDLPF